MVKKLIVSVGEIYTLLDLFWFINPFRCLYNIVCKGRRVRIKALQKFVVIRFRLSLGFRRNGHTERWRVQMVIRTKL